MVVARISRIALDLLLASMFILLFNTQFFLIEASVFRTLVILLEKATLLSLSESIAANYVYGIIGLKGIFRQVQ